MLFNVAGLLKDQIGATREYEFDELATLFHEVKAVESYVGRVKLTHLNEGILAEATVDTVVEMQCSRCLQPALVPLHLEFTELYQPSIDIGSGLPVADQADEEVFRLDEHHHLDLSEAVRQYTIVNLPQFVLCKEDCAGLCPNCGADLNEGSCDCPKQSVDPRLEALGKLLSEDERSE
ncbi:MAG: YceD family protein [Chloroflexota bacterium]